MRRGLLILVAWLVAVSAVAQTIQPGQQVALAAVNAAAIINVTTDTTVTVQVQGTWTGTLTFRSSLLGSVFTDTNCVPVNGSTATTTTTSNGIWTCTAIGLNFLETVFSSFGSGSAIISYQTAYISSGGSSGGGASSSVSVVQGGNTAAVNASSQLSVNCANCSGSGVSQQDNTGFTPGTTNFVPVGGEVDDVGTTAVTENSAGAARITAQRGLHVNLRTLAGAETGIAALPLQVSLANTGANSNAILIDRFGGIFPSTQSGTWTVQPGNTANTTAWLVTGAGGTFPVTGTFFQATQPVSNAGTFAVQAAQSGTWNVTNVSGTVSLPTGASTEATLSTLQTQTAVPTTIFDGLTNVTTAGTRVVLAASQAVKGVTIKARSTNTGIIYVGNASVASTNGLQLKAGESVAMAIANLNTVNIDSSVNGEGVTYLGVN